MLTSSSSSLLPALSNISPLMQPEPINKPSLNLDMSRLGILGCSFLYKYFVLAIEIILKRFLSPTLSFAITQAWNG